MSDAASSSSDGYRVVKFKTGQWWHIVSANGNLTVCGLVVGFRDIQRTATDLFERV